jgi:transcriptional regulator with XRE-family HTH domain
MYEKPVADFSTRLREAMERRGVTAADLSRETQISTSAISRYLKGEFTPKQDKMHALAISLRVSPAWLMGYDVSIDGKDNKPSDSNLRRDKYTFIKSLNKATKNMTLNTDKWEHSFDEEAAMAKLFSSNSDRDKQFFLHIIGIYKAMKETTLDSEDKEFIKKYHALDESSQRLIEEMIDKLLLTQQMAQKNTTTADSDGGEDSGTQKGTPSLQQVPFCEKVK